MQEAAEEAISYANGLRKQNPEFWAARLARKKYFLEK